MNRTVMSNFINQTYGVNFRRYLNQCRIREYQTLIAHPSNEQKIPYQVMTMAGFKDSRHFQRAIQLENTYKEQTDKEPPINKKDDQDIGRAIVFSIPVVSASGRPHHDFA